MTAQRFTGFVRADRGRIIDGAGTPLQLRGIGLGNWLLPEGYMWRFGDELGSPRQIEARVSTLVGPTRAAEFWARYLDTFVTERDIARIAELGFDHVRLPINSRGLIDDSGGLLENGFARVDDVIRWCESHGLWVLLDLHGAPGGQTGTNIDDSPNGRPELFMQSRHRELTVSLWTEIARRYRSRTAVLGYDLLNEPLPDEWQHVYPRELIELYAELTLAIRSVDPNHLIMYEGTHWATNWSIFTEVLDQNSALQFHRYWCPPDRSSIRQYLDSRERLGLPIFMGEGGENTPEWIYTAHRLYEQHDIGWNFWPWKKLDTRTSPVSAVRPDGWNAIADPRVCMDPDKAWSILTAFLDATRLENCEPRDEIVNALFARPPLRVPGWGFIDDRPGFVDRFADHRADGVWHHTAGEPYRDDELMPVSVTKHTELRFPLATAPGSWSIAAEHPDAFEIRWEDGHLIARATRTTRVSDISIGAPVDL